MNGEDTGEAIVGSRLMVVRHGQTDWNREGRMQGSTDIPLNDTGRQQAREAGDRVAGLGLSWDLLFSSPLSRARETAEIIGSRIGLDAVGIVPEIVERHYGGAEGAVLTYEQSRDPGALFEGVEAEAEVYRRGVQALKALALAHPGKNLVVVSHGTLLRRVLKASTPGDWSAPVPNATPVEVDVPGLFAWDPATLQA